MRTLNGSPSVLVQRNKNNTRFMGIVTSKHKQRYSVMLFLDPDTTISSAIGQNGPHNAQLISRITVIIAERRRFLRNVLKKTSAFFKIQIAKRNCTL